MKKLLVLSLAICVLFSSCGTVFGGHITDCQKTKPANGKRQVRTGALVLDILTGGIWVIIDFADGGMYKPCDSKK